MLIVCVGENSQAGILHMLVTGQAKKASKDGKDNAKQPPARASAGSQPDNEVVDLDASAALSGLALRRGRDRKDKTLVWWMSFGDRVVLAALPFSVCLCSFSRCILLQCLCTPFAPLCVCRPCYNP